MWHQIHGRNLRVTRLPSPLTPEVILEVVRILLNLAQKVLHELAAF